MPRGLVYRYAFVFAYYITNYLIAAFAIFDVKYSHSKILVIHQLSIFVFPFFREPTQYVAPKMDDYFMYVFGVCVRSIRSIYFFCWYFYLLDHPYYDSHLLQMYLFPLQVHSFYCYSLLFLFYDFGSYCS